MTKNITSFVPQGGVKNWILSPFTNEKTKTHRGPIMCNDPVVTDRFWTHLSSPQQM